MPRTSTPSRHETAPSGKGPAAQFFRYRARNTRSQQLIRGRAEAAGVHELLQRLHDMGYIPVDVRPDVASAGWKRLASALERPGPRELAALYRQLSSMLHAGLPLLDALDVAGRQLSGKLAEAVSALQRGVETGLPLHAAMADVPHVFPALHRELVRAAEAAGNLEVVVERLASDMEREADLRQRVRSAAIYPAMVLLFSLGLVGVLVTFIIPTFTRLFAELRIDLPAPTRVVLALASPPALAAAGGLAGAAALAWLVAQRLDRGRRRRDSLLLRLPVAGPIVAKAHLARVCRTLATLLRSAYPLPEALELAAAVAGNAVFAAVLRDAREAVTQGQPLSAALALSGVMPPFLVQMVAGGEQAGNLDEMVDRVADAFSAEVRHTLDGLSSVLEPVLIAVIGGVVGMLALSVFLPIFKLLNSLEGSF